MPTIKDVARIAKVSIKTVSRVVNRDEGVREATRERVEEAIRALNYVPDSIARSLRNNRTGTFGLITDVVATTPYSVDIIGGVQDACAAAGLMVLIASTKGRRDLEEQAFRTLIERKVDGILYATMYHREVTALPASGELPMVLINCFVADDRLPAIVPDDFGGGYAATRHLIDLGHRDIALISLNPAIHAAELRRNGYRQALVEAGLQHRPQWERPGQVFADSGEPFTACEEATALLSDRPRPSAIVCGNDAIAMRVYNAARRLGLRVPEDLSVIGYDNYLSVAEGLDPMLTTMALPYYQMGARAVQLLSEMNAGPVSPTRAQAPCPIVVRGSCRAV